VLAELDEALSCQYGITNANIHEGKNPYIKFKNTGFTLSTPTQEESDAEPSPASIHGPPGIAEPDAPPNSEPAIRLV